MSRTNEEAELLRVLSEHEDPEQSRPEPEPPPLTQAESGPGDAGEPSIPLELPILPIRGTVVFPATVQPLTVGRPSSRKLLDDCLPESKIIGLLTQRDEEQDEPSPADLYDVGTAVMVLKLIRQPDETVSIIVHGLRRFKVKRFIKRRPYLRARVEPVEEKAGKGKPFRAAINQLRDQARQLIEHTPNAPEQAMTVLMNIDDPSNLVDFLAANLNLETPEKQDLLEEFDVARRARVVHVYVSSHLEIAKLQEKIQADVQSSIDEAQRKFYLREQLKAIQTELGEGGDGTDQMIAELKRKLEEAGPPEKVMSEAMRDLNRLESIPPASPEYSLIMTYLELVAELPWNKSSKDKLDLKVARQVLDRDHYDLDKVKRRLIEYLAVRKLNPEGRGPILCFVGPPGVGKTSLGQSIADALGRSFARLSLGGIRDEAEVRGHRRTYIGAMPGRIIQEIRRAGTNNPVMMLDEVDKLAADIRGDPSSALLEVLDPRQNHAFVDRYLDVPFDLSQVIFIATANYIGNVPPALRDRMEVITLPGYTDNEKVQIAKRYLVPRQLKENGLTVRQCKWQASGLRKVMHDYTREAGVRELERQIGAVCRAIAAQVATDADAAAGDGKADGKSNGSAKKANAKSNKKPPARKKTAVTKVDDKLVRELLGPEKYFRELDRRTKEPGVVVGLAYTPVGGEILFIEAAAYPGKGRVILTGHIGDVMKESAQAAMSLFKSRADHFHYNLAHLAEQDVHIHVPAGAVPKDGPSAGAAMYTAIVSLLLNIPVRHRLAMTGEITLSGLVLPIGGVKEKSLAASRAGLKIILLPDKNRRDLEEVDSEVRKRVSFEFVDNVDHVLEHALGKAELDKAIAANKKKAKQTKDEKQKKAQQTEAKPTVIAAKARD